MAASKKTAVLGLSLWAGTDKPRRADFVADNEALEEAVGGHLQDTSVHLTADRVQKIDTPWEVRPYAGNGSATRTMLFSFEPSMVMVFPVGRGMYEHSGGCTKQYGGMAVPTNGSSLGLSISTIQVAVKQDQTPPASGCMAALNEKNVNYLMVAFR